MLQNSVPSRAFAARHGSRPCWKEPGVRVLRQRTRIRLIQVEIRDINLIIDIARLVGDNAKDVCTAIPATQRRKTPVGGDRRNGRVVGVKGIILGAPELHRDRTAHQNTENSVVLRVGVILVEGEQNQRVVHEVDVVEQGRHPVPLPLGGEGDVGVVPIVSHVGSDESPLGKLPLGQVVLKAGEVLDLAQTCAVVGDRFVGDQWVVFAHIVRITGFLVGEVETLEPRVGQMLLILSPGNALGVEQVRDGGDVCGHRLEVIIVHAPIVTSSRSDVIRLRRVGGAIVIGPGQ